MTVSERMTAEKNVENNLGGLFNEDWFYDYNSPQKSAELYESFVEEFTDWLIGQGVDLASYKNMKVDLAYYLSEYVGSKEYNGSALEGIYEKVGEWLENEFEFANSRENLDGLYMFENGGFDSEIATEDINENAKKQMDSGVTHGFKSAKDLAEAAELAASRNLETYDVYDAGGMGWHSYDEDSEWFETGCIFLGNGEEHYELDSLPFDEEVDFTGVYGHNGVYGDHMSWSSDLMYCYGVKWEYVEAAGDELGLRG